MAVDLLRLNKLLNVVQVSAHLNAAAAIRVLARLHDPKRRSILRVLLQHLVILGVVESFEELLELTVGLALFDVVGQWNRVVGILAARFQVDHHIVVNRLLVAQVEVVLLVVRRYHVVTGVVLLFLLLIVVVFLAFADV